MSDIRPVMLVIMDGWGWREATEGNAIRLAETPNLDRYGREYPFTLIEAAGKAVGLPQGQMGNSEVGHLNLGAGRVVYQELTRIDMAIEDGTFYENPVLNKVMDEVKGAGTRLHIMGLVSHGGVHSQMEHLFALIRLAASKGLHHVVVHAFLDGRDTEPTSGAGYVAELMKFMAAQGCGQVATICGRYWAMDRDKRWDRVERAFRALVLGEGERAQDPVEAVKAAYARGQTDEFVEPVVMVDQGGEPLPRIADGDGVIFFNFRADRARQLTRAFTEEGFSEFDCSYRPRLLSFVTMTRYDETFDLPVAFPPHHLEKILGEVVSRAGLTQLRIAETEKYAHVTYFFNGGEEREFPGEERCLIPSPRDVPTYDLKPEMSAQGIADELLARMEGDYSLIVVNFANGDMVGHTGILEAAVKACETVDRCVGRIVEAWRKRGGAAIITADHGNAEVMVTGDGGPCTAHSTNPVPLYLVDDRRRGVALPSGGRLGDVAPTILKIMGLEVPPEMEGEGLLPAIEG